MSDKKHRVWFEAVKSNNVTLVTKKMKTMARSYDLDQTDERLVKFKGFTAMHYACYLDNAEVAEVVLSSELLIYTQNTDYIQISATGISQNAVFQLAPQSSCLQIALLRQAQKCVKLIMRYLHQNPQLKQGFFGTSNKAFQTNLFVAAQCSHEEAFNVINTKELLEAELVFSLCGPSSIIQQTLATSNVRIAQFVLNLCKVANVREFVFEKLAQNSDPQKSVLAALQNDLQQQMSPEKQQVNVIFRTILGAAFQFFKNHPNQQVYGPKTQALSQYQNMLIFNERI